ncbi:DctP family TRAP transporter solute-binding subunit [Oceanobacillus longus]|uniref:DctP family TRAP transporter solute-binding subunit n=1 Tax=Oceanobacillus longus TaxID=930120 RepID=A0ABV8H212_9BACI
MKKLLMFLLIGIFLVVFAACSNDSAGKSEATNEGNGNNESTDDEIVIRFSHVAPPHNVKGLAAEKFAELVAEKTDNKVKVEVYDSGQLYGDGEELDAILSGNVEMIAPSMSKLVQLDPRWQFIDLPYLFKDKHHLRDFFTSETAQSLLESEQLVNNGLIGLGFWENGFINFTNSQRPISSPEDLEGLTFRVQSGQLIEAKYNTVGANTATIAWAEAYTALQQGVADGAEVTPDQMDVGSFYEVLDYLTLSNHGRIDYAVIMNKDFWDTIPEDLRGQVSEALVEASEYQWGIAEENNQTSLEKLIDEGMEVIEPSEADREQFVEAFQPVYEEYRDVITPEIIDGIRDLE